MNILSKKWAQRFLELAELIAQWSKDSTKVGCVIVSEDGNILSTGYNGLPRSVVDSPDRLERPAKYLWTAHAEENAITFAARHGISLNGALAFVTHIPCSHCAGMLINAGISTVLVGNGFTSMPEVEFVVSAEKLREASVPLRVVSDLL